MAVAITEKEERSENNTEKERVLLTVRQETARKRLLRPVALAGDRFFPLH
jgi:hypothetical protein